VLDGARNGAPTLIKGGSDPEVKTYPFGIKGDYERDLERILITA
jgi:hypothetical protein